MEIQHEVIKDGINGGLFEAHNVEELKKKLIDMAIKTKTWQAMRKRCIVDANTYKPDPGTTDKKIT